MLAMELNLNILQLFFWVNRRERTFGVTFCTDGNINVRRLRIRMLSIFHVSKGRREKSSIRITVWNHEVCRGCLMKTVITWDRSTILFITKATQKLLKTVRCDITWDIMSLKSSGIRIRCARISYLPLLQVPEGTAYQTAVRKSLVNNTT